MNAPLTRDQQIELMRDAVARHDLKMATWMENSTIREVVARPPSGHRDEVEYLRSDVKIACCG